MNVTSADRVKGFQADSSVCSGSVSLHISRNAGGGVEVSSLISIALAIFLLSPSLFLLPPHYSLGQKLYVRTVFMTAHVCALPRPLRGTGGGPRDIINHRRKKEERSQFARQSNQYVSR